MVHTLLLFPDVLDLVQIIFGVAVFAFIVEKLISFLPNLFHSIMFRIRNKSLHEVNEHEHLDKTSLDSNIFRGWFS